MIAADIERIARRSGTIAISALAAEVYRERPAPKRPDVTVKTVLCEMRRRGVPVHLHQGFVTIGARPQAVPMSAGIWASHARLEVSDLELAVLRALRVFGDIALTARELAAEIGFDGVPGKLCCAMHRLVAKGFPIDHVGRGYRLARCAP